MWGPSPEEESRQPGVFAFDARISLAGKLGIPDTVDKWKSARIQCNARASNDCAHERVMVHACNRHAQVVVTRFLDAYGVEYSKDRYALNELIQWVWRSAVRNGAPACRLLLWHSAGSAISYPSMEGI